MNNEDISKRLKAFALIIKFGHDLFNAKNFSDTAMFAINDSQKLLNFRTSSLFEINNKITSLIAQFGQIQLNTHSRLAIIQGKFIQSLTFADESIIISENSSLPEELAKNNSVYLCLKLSPPKSIDENNLEFIWLLEYEKEIPPYALNTAKLLSNSISEALYFHKLCRKNSWNVKKQINNRWVWLLLIIILVAIMFIKIPETSTAEFTLKAPNITSCYAWYDGVIAKCLRQDGERVKKGDVIVQYDTSLLEYKLAVAISELNEIELELDLEQQNSFTDQEKLGKVKLLEAKRDSMKIAVKEARYFLDNSKLFAPIDGILVLTDRRAEELTNKAVRIGDKIFEIFGGDGMVADIPVNEQNASILCDNLSVVLFLHTAPEVAIPAKILEISQFMELSKQRTYCYNMRAKLPPNLSDLRYGMRGVAKLYGNKETIGYALFKGIILYLRGL